MEVVNDKCLWKGVLKKEITTISGDKCFPIAPTADPDLPGQFIFDTQMLLDVGVCIAASIEKSASSTSSKLTSETRACKICKINIHKKKMKCHVAIHILTGKAVGARV